jgi:hypothetical protein
MKSVLLDVVVTLFPQHVPDHVRSLLDDRNRPTASCVFLLERIDLQYLEMQCGGNIGSFESDGKIRGATIDTVDAVHLLDADCM